MQSAVERRRHGNEEDGSEDMAADDESNLDAHGKSFSFLLLSLLVEVRLHNEPQQIGL